MTSHTRRHTPVGGAYGPGGPDCACVLQPSVKFCASRTALRAEVLRTPISDHQPITVSAPIGRVRKQSTMRTVRSWGRADWDAICLDLLLADWTTLETSDDVNSMVDTFMEIWWSVLDRHCPARTRRSRRRGCPWITNDHELRPPSHVRTGRGVPYLAGSPHDRVPCGLPSSPEFS